MPILQRSASQHKPDSMHEEVLEEMVVDATNVVANGEAETHDEEWAVSVDEAPKKKYTIYIQTPSQQMTLTRAPHEITDLHAKLRSHHPSASLPPLPGSPDDKRRSSFLNTLSRLAKPQRGMNASTPAIVDDDDLHIPALAAYLAFVANHPALRHSRAWRRFVRVRADDLEARPERVVKRVRSEGAITPALPALAAMSSLDVAGDMDDLPATPTKPIPVADILASPSMQQAIATPLPPATPEPATPPKSTHALPTPGATPPDPRPENRLSTGSDVFANASGSEHDNVFGAFATETDPDPKSKSDKKPARKVVVDDFEMMRVLGKGCAGKVLLVRHRATTELYALKAITKRHVLAHQELQHTLTEQAVLKRMAREARDPFVVKLWWSFHDKENLFLVMDFHPGGDLATQLARWGRLGRDRARFYAAEIVEGCEGLHAAGVIYRDLKPENILIGADGHIVLTDFGLSKEFPRKHTPTDDQSPVPHWIDSAASPGRASTTKRLDRDMTTTFCGTAEYLAPEVIQGLPYSYEVDWWSFGTMLYEMLTGITPFWANNHSDMYVRVLQDELQFPDDKAMDQDTKSLIRGLLQRNPALRMCEPRVKKHPYFSMIDWQHVYYKRYIPPYIPPIDPHNAGDTQNFDDAFLDMEPVIADETDHTDSEREDSDSESARTASGGKSPERPPIDETVDVFDGYSFKGRDSIIIDDDVDEHEEDGDVHIRDVAVLEPQAGDGPITVDESQATPHTTAADLPKTPDAKTPDEEPVTPTRPTAELPAEVEDEEPTARISSPAADAKSLTPVASPVLDVCQLPPLPAEKPGELAEPPTSPAAAAAAATATATAASPAVSPVASPAAARATSPTPEPSTSQPARAKPKREKSGATALDRVLDADTDDDDWDLVERPKGEEAAYNGRTGAGAKQGNNLFARGVVDRYRLTVFRKASHPALSKTLRAHANTDSSDPVGSPTPPDSKRRGRSTGLNVRKSAKQFLRAKSPSSSASRAQVRVVNNGSGLLSPAPSVPAVPSLKSKSSALSGTSPASPGSSDPSISETRGPSGSQSAGELAAAADSADSQTVRRKSLSTKIASVPASPIEEGKKSKKTKKMLSIFALDSKR
ncbi:Serine/Threonine kinase catalytic domain containing protein [Ceratobasidium theobromae]|uniref:Serine/Threonine kinase catalytic domain containing protein n=1 Tax=Ceratobasidium theobromae TaxID=1582974 RepID=A0A5N5QN55_9AGAM|nr:Serine/Threonine kinase catalytic domain containing protein [Ceratobasidium theobromae]